MNEFSRIVKRHDLKISDGCSIWQNNPDEAASLPLLLLPWESAETCHLPCQGGRFTSHLWETACALSPPRRPSATIPGHICRALPSGGSFLPPVAEFLSSFESVAFPVLYIFFFLRNMLLLQSFATTSIWQSIGVKPGLYQSTAVKSYLI